jgi:dihydroorotate dehydrogenase (NAD+) catalytic subunit
MEVILETELAGIRMKNPVMPAAGTFGYGQEMSQFYDLSELGAIVTKSTSLLPKVGNPQPRIMETAAGMINFIGLENPGSEVLIKEELPFLRQFNLAVIVSIFGQTINEFKQLTQKLDRVNDIDGLEINISCPNVEQGGMTFGTDPQATAEVVGAVRQVTSRPLIAKLTPNVTDIRVIAQAAEYAGANALSLANTFKGMGYFKNGLHKGKWITGGLSGPCIKPMALCAVCQVISAVKIPVIGVGGITNFEDALEFFYLGAKAVQIGTANFVNPQVISRIIRDLKKYLQKQQIPDIQGLKRLK